MSRVLKTLVSNCVGRRRLFLAAARHLSCRTANFVSRATSISCFLVREVRKERDSIRTFIAQDERAEPIKFEIILEGRIPLDGALESPGINSPKARTADPTRARSTLATVQRWATVNR